MKTNLILVGVIVLLVALNFKQCGDNREPEIIQGPPAIPDTVLVLASDTVGLQKLEKQIGDLERRLRKEIAKQKPIQTIERHTVTEYLPIARPDERWYVTAVDVGEDLGDTTYVSSTRYTSRGDSLLQRSALTSHFTPGPLRGLVTDSTGTRLQWGDFPKNTSCNFLCKAKFVGYGAGAGAILYGVLGK